MTTRRWMIVVAVAALGTFLTVEAVRLVRMARSYRASAAKFATLEQAAAKFEQDDLKDSEYNWKLSMAGEFRRHLPQLKADYEDARRWRLYANYASRMKEKYLHAASHPWESVPPDPQPPELPR